MRPAVSAALVGALLVGATASACSDVGGGEASGSATAPTTVTNPGTSTTAARHRRPARSTDETGTAVPSRRLGPPAATTHRRRDSTLEWPAASTPTGSPPDCRRATQPWSTRPQTRPTEPGPASTTNWYSANSPARPELDDAVLAAVDPSAGPAVERIVRARQFLQQRSASRPPQPLPAELPAWTIVEPEPVETLRAHYAEAEQLTGIAWYWLAAIHLQETRMGRIRGVSSAGAVGPMQFLPTTWEVCCTGDPTVTRDAIVGAATYLAQSGGPDDMATALYEYNPNDGYVAVVTAYAESLRDEPELLPGYHAYQVFVGTTAGTIRLPIGYSAAEPLDAATYLAEYPADAA